MNIENKLLKQTSLEKLIVKLKEEGKQIFAPVIKNDQVEFAEISAMQEMTEDYISFTQSITIRNSQGKEMKVYKVIKE